MTDYKTMTIAQLKETLTAKGIKFSAKNNKNTLLSLIPDQEETFPVNGSECNQPQNLPNLDICEAGVSLYENAAQDEESLLDDATKIIDVIVGGWSDLDTLTRYAMLNEVSITMGEDYVNQNRKKLIAVAVAAVENEMNRRAGPEERAPEIENPPLSSPSENPRGEKEEKEVPVKKQRVKKERVNKKKEKVVKNSQEIQEVEADKKAGIDSWTLEEMKVYLENHDMEKEKKKLEAFLAVLTKKLAKKERSKKAEGYKPRQPTAFNIFMKEEMSILKEKMIAGQVEEMNHRIMFSIVSTSWKTSVKNPKNVVA